MEAPLPFCYVAERDHCWVAVTAGDYEVQEFYASHAGDTIRPIKTREDWALYCKSVPMFERKKRSAS